MSLDVLVTTNRIEQDPTGRDFIDYVVNNQERLLLADAVLYYDFPAYADYDALTHKPDVVILSPHHGIVILKFCNDRDRNNGSRASVLADDESLAQFTSTLIGRLLKSKALRSGRSSLSFQVTPILFLSSEQGCFGDLESDLAYSFHGFSERIDMLRSDVSLSSVALQEARSVIEGAKALTRAQKRTVENPDAQKFAVALSKLEAEIANFDQKQRRAAIVTIPGPHRIRGLAGSGKTVILAMKAAHLHMNNPEARILITFLTKSLKSSIKSLVSRFYRHYHDDDPDWSKIEIRHSWGGRSLHGTYADACRRADVFPLSLSDARSRAPIGVDPFDWACSELLKENELAPFYDHVLIDEGQDFPSSFYRLCYAICKGEKDRKSIVWAYDDLQNILNVKMRTPEELFGADGDGEPCISLARSAQYLPQGALNDTVLSKCYRNQGQVLVTAHALGFGVYGEIVQMLEDANHWEDVGYEVVGGDFRVGSTVRVLRSESSSPLSLIDESVGPLIDCYVANDFAGEVTWIVEGIREMISGGLNPEDIMIIALDDRYARNYFTQLSGALGKIGISCNNIIADPYSEPTFCLENKVTLTTVYRAKGNEAASVFALGVDAVPIATRSGRNKLFTAFTRTKAWLRVSGVGEGAARIKREIDSARAKFPLLQFTMPDLKKVELIQRDLSERSARARAIREEYEERLRGEGFSEDEIVDILSVEERNEKK